MMIASSYMGLPWRLRLLLARWRACEHVACPFAFSRHPLIKPYAILDDILLWHMSARALKTGCSLQQKRMNV